MLVIFRPVSDRHGRRGEGCREAGVHVRCWTSFYVATYVCTPDVCMCFHQQAQPQQQTLPPKPDTSSPDGGMELRPVPSVATSHQNVRPGEGSGSADGEHDEGSFFFSRGVLGRFPESPAAPIPRLAQEEVRGGETTQSPSPLADFSLLPSSRARR
jgi:hypothetical protein